VHLPLSAGQLRTPAAVERIATSQGVWLLHYLVRPDYRRGALAVRLLNMFRQPSFTVTIAFGISTAAVSLYTALHARLLETIPRHAAIFPDAVERTTHLLRLAYPDWPAARAGQGVALPSESRRGRTAWDGHSRQLGHTRLAAVGRMHGRGSTRHSVLVLALPESSGFYLSYYLSPATLCPSGALRAGHAGDSAGLYAGWVYTQA
jgi:hypothetical protein